MKKLIVALLLASTLCMTGCGDTKIFTINPDTNYQVKSVIVDGEAKGALNSYTVNNISADHTISATFSGSGENYTINASADAYTIIYPHGTKSFNNGDNQTYLTQAKPGSDLLNIIVDNQILHDFAWLIDLFHLLINIFLKFEQ